MTETRKQTNHDKPHPHGQGLEALRLVALLDADEWPGSMTLVSYARACAAELRRLAAIEAAARKLMTAKGRYRTERNYQALEALIKETP